MVAIKRVNTENVVIGSKSNTEIYILQNIPQKCSRCDTLGRDKHQKIPDLISQLRYHRVLGFLLPRGSGACNAAPAHCYLFSLFLLDNPDCKTAQALMLTTACSITYNTYSFSQAPIQF